MTIKHTFLTFGFLMISCAALAQDGTTTDRAEERPDRGGFFLEPMLTYTRNDSSIETSQLPGITDDTSADADGGGAGLRLGGHVGEVMFLALDGRYSRIELNDSSYGNAEGDSFNWGPLIGFQTPYWGLRVWGNYIVGGEFNPESGNNGFDVKFEEPKGWRVGAGFHIGPVSLNLEYQDLTYDKTRIQSFGSIPGTAASEVDYDVNGYTASLSFPVEL